MPPIVLKKVPYIFILAWIIVYYRWFYTANSGFSCPSATLFKIDCAFCGTQRAWHALFNCDFMESLQLNPMGLITTIGLMLCLIVKNPEKLFNYFLNRKMIGFGILVFLILSFIKNT